VGAGVEAFLGPLWGPITNAVIAGGTTVAALVAENPDIAEMFGAIGRGLGTTALALEVFKRTSDWLAKRKSDAAMNAAVAGSAQPAAAPAAAA
jgi:hypothetical protein